jgi:hypothetical protein
MAAMRTRRSRSTLRFGRESLSFALCGRATFQSLDFEPNREANMNDAAKATETGAYPSFLSTEPKAGDEDKFWTTVGSSGTVDEADVGKVFLDGSVVQMGRVLVPEPAAKSPARKTAAGRRFCTWARRLRPASRR